MFSHKRQHGGAATIARALLTNIRARRDIIRELKDEELIKWYRLNGAGIRFVAELVKDTLQSDTKRSRALTAVRVIITLRFPATGKMQQWDIVVTWVCHDL